MLTRWWRNPGFARARPGITDAAVPVALFFLLHSWLGRSEILALAAGAVFLAARVVLTMVRRRRTDGFQLFLLGLTAASLALAALADDPRIVIARSSVASVVIAAGCVITAFVGKPLIGALLRPSFDLLSPHHAPAWDRCWDDDPRFRQRARALNLFVGCVAAVSAAARVITVYHTSTEVAVLASGLPPLLVWAAASPVLIRLGRPVFHTMRTTRLRMAEEPEPHPISVS